MTSEHSGPGEAVKGVMEGAKGKVKEVAGAVVGNDDLVREGKAQQDKGDAHTDAAEHEGKADAARAAAEAAEQRERAHQNK